MADGEKMGKEEEGRRRRQKLKRLD